MSTAIKPVDQRHSPPGTDAPFLSSLSDSDLLEAWRRDAYGPALAALVERYSGMVLSVCRRRCRTQVDAEDAYQTTFLYLARNSRKIRRPECLAGWLQRVAQRASIATLSSSKRETEPMVEPPTDPDDPLDRLTQRHEAIVLDEELAELPEHYRSAIVMHCYEDRPLHLLAEHFGTTVGSIRGRLQRGKQLLAQRLRRRGVVPVVAFAAAEAWKVSDAQAAVAAQQFIDATSTGCDLPDPPIDTPRLESLLSQGVRLMPSLYTALGLIGGTALIAAVLNVDGTHSLKAQGSGSEVIALPGEVLGQLGADVVAPVQPQVVSAGGTGTQAGTVAQASMGAQAGMGAVGATGGMVGMPGLNNQNMQWTEKAVAPTPTGPIANRIMATLDSEIALNVTTSLEELPEALSEALKIPVMMDERGVAFAKQAGSTSVQLAGQQPLRTALRRALHPMGLKAIVEDEGLVITADPAALVHKGIGVNRWINIDEDAAEAIDTELAKENKVEFVESPLQEIVAYLHDQHGLPVILDVRALEEIGLSGDEPISFVADKISLRNFLDLALRPHSLTYTIQGETLLITSEDAAESSLVSRVYWLEGTGFADTDFASLSDAIQTTIVPDTWEQMGGASTMVPLRSTRPAIVVSTTYTIHHSIERLFDALRETHFGGEPVLERVPGPSTPQPGTMPGGMGGFGGGMGGGLGGGGMF